MMYIYLVFHGSSNYLLKIYIDYIRVVYDLETYMQRSRSSRDFFEYGPDTHTLDEVLCFYKGGKN